MTCPLLTMLVVACGLGSEPAPATTETIRVLVARQDIQAGVTIDQPEKLFRFVRYFKGEEPTAGITELEKLKGKVVKRALAQDQPVKETDLMRAGGAALFVPQGQRAIAIKVEADPGIGGFILPGCRVDVIAVAKQPEGKDVVAPILVQDLLVLAVDIAGPNLAMTVTLAATPEQTEKLALGCQGEPEVGSAGT